MVCCYELKSLALITNLVCKAQHVFTTFRVAQHFSNGFDLPLIIRFYYRNVGYLEKCENVVKSVKVWFHSMINMT